MSNADKTGKPQLIDIGDEPVVAAKDSHATGGKTKPADSHATGGTAKPADSHATGGKP
ncbi:hypothetical protein JNUCC64_13490 [Streptomyces sp. JNUCC 64]